MGGGGERENKFFMEGEINKFFGTGSNTTKKTNNNNAI